MTENEKRLIQLLRSAKNPSALYAVADAATAIAQMDFKRSKKRKIKQKKAS